MYRNKIYLYTLNRIKPAKLITLDYKTQFYFVPTICLYYSFNRNDRNIPSTVVYPIIVKW